MIKKIGILDFGFRSNYRNTLEILPDLVEDAIICEKLGFERMWYGEHFGFKNMPWLSPEPLIPLICGSTSELKVGIAGTLISYASPIRIAANMKLLNNLFPKRIDLGFAKGFPEKAYADLFNIKPHTAGALTREIQIELIKQTTQLLAQELENFENGIIIPPFNGLIPELWNLVSSGNGYLDCLKMKLNCSRNIFLKTADLDPSLNNLEVYKKEYQKMNKKKPVINLAVAGSCQENNSAREKIFSSAKSYGGFLNLDTAIIAPSETFEKRLNDISERYQINEIMFLELSLTVRDRRNSFRSISEVMNLKKRS